MRWRANINRAYKEYGWTVRIRGVQSGGEVINLPTHTFPTDDGGVDLKCPTEIAITDRREAELSKSGLLPLIHRKNTDKAAFIGAQSLYRPKKYDKRRGDRVRQPLGAHSLHVRGLALQPLPQMHGARPDRRDQGDVRNWRRWLQSWIIQYVDADPRNSSHGDEGEQAACRGQASTFSPTRRTRAITRRTFLSAPAFPARRHGHRHEPRLAAARPEGQASARS